VRLLHGTAAGVVDRDGSSRPIDKQFFAGFMLLAQHYILLAAPALVQLAETGDMCCNTCQPLCGGRIYVAQSFESHD
jgi:hypothetical protein